MLSSNSICAALISAAWLTQAGSSPLNTGTGSPPVGYMPGGGGATGPNNCSSWSIFYASGSAPNYGNLASLPISYTGAGQSTWLPLGQNSPGYPYVHTLYYYNKNVANAYVTNTQNLIGNFLQQVSSSSWFKPLKSYYDSGHYSGGTLNLSGLQKGAFLAYDCNQYNGCPSTLSYTATTADSYKIFTDAIDNRGFAQSFRPSWLNTPGNGQYGPNAQDVYVFVVDVAFTEISSGGQMGVSYCGYHDNFLYAGLQNQAWLNYAMVQIPKTGSNCEVIGNTAKGLPNTVNGGIYDSFMFTLAHEIIETILGPASATDPGLWQWADVNGNEVMDKCGCAIPGMTTTSGGLAYNVNFNGYYFVLPAVWDPVAQKCSFSGSTSGTSTPPTSSCPSTYTVQGGDYCNLIASKLSTLCPGITGSAIISANSATVDNVCDNLNVGQVLSVPGSSGGSSSGGSSSSCPSSYTVVSGDYCNLIASKLASQCPGITGASIIAANSVIKPDCSNLNVGQVITP